MRSRTKSSVLNSSISSFIYIIRLILGFVSRSVFIEYLGAKYLGLNGLFTNILGFLSLAELGIGTSITYELYKPLANQDYDLLKSFLNLYRKAYNIIGVVIGVIGIGIIPFLPYILNDGVNMPHVYIYYLLFLANSVVSYFFTYKRSLLNADQKNYLTAVNDFVFYVITVGVQIGILIWTKNFMLYLIIQIVATLISNFSISAVVNYQYKELKTAKASTLLAEVKHKLFKNVIGNMASPIGTAIVTGTDNILISKFIGLTAVGVYSNYTLIINAVRSLIQQVTGSITASIGNLIVLEGRDKVYGVFKKYVFINSSFCFVGGVGIFALINPFISFWIGKHYLLPMRTVFLLTLYLIMSIYQITIRNYLAAYGLFWQQRWKSIIESVINIFFSLLFLMQFHWGMDGVILGNIMSSVLVIIWFEPYILFRYGLKRSALNYAFGTLFFYIRLICSMLLLNFVRESIEPSKMTFLALVKLIFSCGCMLIVLYLLLFGWDKSFRSLIKKLTKQLK